MAIAPARVARTYVPTGSVWDLARNRDVTTGVGKLIAQDVAATTDRPGVWLQWEMLAGWPVDYGTVADEAAMLALHSYADSALVNPIPRYVAPGDSCTRSDDPGWRWHCIAGHGLTLADWERRPLAEALDGFAAADHTHAIADVTGLTDALAGKQASLTNAATVAKITEAAGLPRWDGGAWPGTGGSVASAADLIEAAGPIAWYRAVVGVEESTGDAAEDGDGVSAWLDQSGNGYHLLQSNATYRPVYSATAVGGKPCIQFSAHHLTQSTLPLDLRNHTVICLMRSTAGSGQVYGRLLVVGLPASGADYTAATANTYVVDNTGDTELRVLSAAFSASMTPAQISRPARLGAYGYRIAAGLSRLTINDTSEFITGNSSSSTSMGLHIGCQWNSGAALPTTDCLHGDICELAVFNRPLGNAEFGAILSALRSYWVG